MDQAMTLVRKELGENAWIVSCIEDHKGVRVTAALEDKDPPMSKAPKLKPFLRLLSKKYSPLEIIQQAMNYHRLPLETQKHFLSMLPPNALTNNPFLTMTHLFQRLYTFSSLELQTFSSPLILVGPPGVGKTVTLMKLAVEALEKRRRVKVITTDTLKTGAVDQICGISQLIAVEVEVAPNASSLEQILKSTDPDQLVLIDTPGINPYSMEEIQYLKELLYPAASAPYLVLEGRGDYLETIDFCICFKRLGIASLIVTKMDTAHRFGSVMAAGSLLKLCRYSTEPLIATRLSGWSAEHLAEFFIPPELKM
jgi:flagellar biosynthesis protein FlhF